MFSADKGLERNFGFDGKGLRIVFRACSAIGSISPAVVLGVSARISDGSYQMQLTGGQKKTPLKKLTVVELTGMAIKLNTIDAMILEIVGMRHRQKEAALFGANNRMSWVFYARILPFADCYC